MAYGQIDRARLEGDALTRWNLRSQTDNAPRCSSGPRRRGPIEIGGISTSA